MSIKLCTLNVRGLAGKQKRLQGISYRAEKSSWNHKTVYFSSHRSVQ